ncbi:uncharacterized protein C22orf15 homolog [Ornithorhynchus anatinus]|uniref:uncharacterized protein C22orf15 homolog n=1 Tax=Ornithorhynchus anatinus TaxID=9258 RepID=UPI0010A82EE1|nr:uncharacterized protein C22orf15 homolog [Ornithorhynchus anatinus]
MFITVRFGANLWELVNLDCPLVNLTAHLKRKGQLAPDAVIALLDQAGVLVPLSEAPSPSARAAGSLLQHRQTYILVRFIKELQRLSEARAHAEARAQAEARARARRKSSGSRSGTGRGHRRPREPPPPPRARAAPLPGRAG